MKATVIGYTQDSEQEGIGYDLEKLKILCGKVAGICYGSGEYFNTYITDPEKARKRFGVVADSGHHSIADHTNVTVLFEGIPKMIAMVLNSLQDYTTSERSGRYTEMSGSNERETKLYDKWRIILKSAIRDEYPQLGDRDVDKLAMENARYFLSVFTPTTMAYTTSLRQWNYIIDWCEDYLHRVVEANTFNFRVYEGIKELKSAIVDLLYVAELRDFKHRKFGFMSIQTGDSSSKVGFPGDLYYDMYRVYYDISFAGLAQAQRHRTLKYYMKYDGSGRADFYLPRILIRNDILCHEWYKDMRSIEDLYPQGILVDVVESGYVEDFLLKCQERLCSRAQLEITRNVEETLLEFEKHRSNLTYGVAKSLDQYVRNLRVNPKCVILGGCKEPCILGGALALDRLI